MTDLGKIKWLAQSTWIDSNLEKGQYEQYINNDEFNPQIDNEMTKRLTQIENILNNAFENESNLEKWLNTYEEEKLKNAISIFWKKAYLDSWFIDYKLWEDYDISDPRLDLSELSKEEIIDITNVIHKPEKKFIRFYIWGTEIFIYNKAYDDLIKNY